MGNEEAANAALEKILLFKPQMTYYLNTFSTANNLVSAWAMKEKGWQDKAEEYLQSWIRREPQSNLAKWVFLKYKNQQILNEEDKINDENIWVLDNLLKINQH
jgi:hypothetical protein